MKEVTVDKYELLNKIKTNREGHRKVFLEALDGYKAKLEEELLRRIEELRAGKKVNRFIELPEPSDHTKDYDQVIEMLNMSTETEVKLSYRDFSQYVMDHWDWREEFINTTSNYR